MQFNQIKSFTLAHLILLGTLVFINICEAKESRTVRPVVQQRLDAELPEKTKEELPSDDDSTETDKARIERTTVRPPSSSLKKGLTLGARPEQPAEDCGEITVPIPDMTIFPLRNHLFGDRRIGDGEEKWLELRAYLKQTPMRVWLTVEVQVREWRVGGDTHYLGANGAIVYDVRQENYGCLIEGVLNTRVDPTLTVYGGPAEVGSGDEAWAYMGRDAVTEKQYGWARFKEIKANTYAFSDANYDSENKDLIAGGSCILNADGDDDGKLGCTNLKFNPLRLRLKRNDLQTCEPFILADHPPLWLKPLTHYRGDSDIKGNDRDIWIADSRRGTNSPYLKVVNGERVQMVGNLGIRERFSDYSSFESSFELDIASRWDVPPQCKIVSAEIASEHIDRSQLINAIKDHNYHAYDGIGLFQKLICRTDTRSNDNPGGPQGGVGCKVYPRTIKINLAHGG